MAPSDHDLERVRLLVNTDTSALRLRVVLVNGESRIAVVKPEDKGYKVLAFLPADSDDLTEPVSGMPAKKNTSTLNLLLARQTTTNYYRFTRLLSERKQ